MKKFMEKTSVRIAVIAIAVLAVIVVVFLAMKALKASDDASSVIDEESITMESTEASEVVDKETITDSMAGDDLEETSQVPEGEEEETMTEETTEKETPKKPARPKQEPASTEAAVPTVESEPAPVVPEYTAPTGSSGNTGGNTGSTPSEPTTEESTEQSPDEYYEENSTVIRSFDASLSEDVHTEEEVISFLEERGFTQYPITYDFAMGGEYSGDTEITGDPGEKRPMYQTFYECENGEFWTVFVINGEIYAKPVIYNLESELPVQVLISESEQVTSYNNKTNKYYVTIPKETAVIIKIVDRIDAETLNRLTSEEIDKL